VPTASTHLEIERRFLVQDTSFLEHRKGIHILQGYLFINTEKSVRIRKTSTEATLTIKVRTPSVRRRLEFEYPILLEDASKLLEILGGKNLITKIRYDVDVEGFHWEVDRFLDANQGLVIAEIELTQETETFPRPPWVAEEITADPRYLNVNLARHPYQHWK